MKTKTKKYLKGIAIGIGVIILIGIILAIYLNSQMPKAKGEPPTLQSFLFEKPKEEYPVSGKFIFLSATELALKIRTREASSLEITQELINYIKNNNYKTNAVVWLFEEEAIQAAKRADEQVANGGPLGLLHGVPVCIKEQIWVAGKPCTINAASFQNFIAKEDAPVVKAWLDEGAIILGTTNVPYLLIDMQTKGDIYPRACNPYDTSRTCGGSTGGGAAAVASGFCPLSLGGDMGGSIRIPAGFCGIYGLKTTENTIDNYGTFPDTAHQRKYVTMTVNGPQARTIEDIELSWKAMIKPWYAKFNWVHADTSKPLSAYKVAWFDEMHFKGGLIPATASLKEKMASLVTQLQKNKIQLTHEEPAHLEEMRQLHWLKMVYMIFHKQSWLIRQLIKHQIKSNKTEVTSLNLMEGVDRIGNLSEGAYKNICLRTDSIKQEFTHFFDRYDFLIMPVTPGEAISHNPDHHKIQVEGQSYLYYDYFHYCMCTNLTGHPSLAIPLGLNQNGLPISIQLIGPMYSEERLIHFAKQIQHLHDDFIPPK